ncbi:MAG: hypothetical protein CMB99_09460 [Flavobacteriaceae bacterium]|nr:hypothetical protein [Flavobacteriaceae bacterium]|tara:strand:- start:443974 stop:444282 length:309 start_codon:yes stop_codon:yes gene_type:complete
MSFLRFSFLKHLMLLLICIKSIHSISHTFNLLDDTAIVLNLDIEDSETEEKLELKENVKINHNINKNPLFLVQTSDKAFSNKLLLYADHIEDFATPPPERIS